MAVVDSTRCTGPACMAPDIECNMGEPEFADCAYWQRTQSAKATRDRAFVEACERLIAERYVVGSAYSVGAHVDEVTAAQAAYEHSLVTATPATERDA